MATSPFSDMMRVEIRDLDDHLIRVLDLRIEPEIVLQADEWKPGVVVPEEELDPEAEEIAYHLNEVPFDSHSDGIPVGAQDVLLDANEQPTAKWAAKRVPKGTPKPPLCSLPDESSFRP